MGILTDSSTCLYDGNSSLATSASEYDFSIGRINMQPFFTNPDVELTATPSAIVGGDTLQTDDPPFYSA